MLDRLIISGIAFLSLFTPLAFGSVHPLAYSFMEAAIFFLLILFALKLFFLRNAGPIVGFSLRPFVLPFALLITFTLFQLVPLPPSVLRVISPSTYEVYTKSLRGWPAEAPYAHLLLTTLEEDKGTRGQEEDKETRGQGDRGTRGQEENKGARGQGGNTWMPLSVAPELTRIDLLRFIASGALFFLLLAYPFGISEHRLPFSGRRRPDSGVRFQRNLLYAIMFSGFVVAALGFLNLFTWNGKILWFFEPYDTGAGFSGAIRASAPFINADHFGNYLALIFPLLITGAFFRSFLTPQKLEAGFRILCAFAAFIVLGSLLLSLSRGGWGGAALGTIVLFSLMAGRHKQGDGARAGRQARHLKRLSIAVAGVAVVGVLLFVGPQGRKQLDLRLDQTLVQLDMGNRLPVWRDASGIVRDFPLMGVGLGAWPELFSRYQSPEIDGFAREAHNDYLEFLSETGLIGFALLAWFFWACLSRILRAIGRLNQAALPVVAALLAGIAAMALHEFFDFNLQIPANALLFTVFLAIALRLSLVTAAEETRRQGDKGTRGQGDKETRRQGETKGERKFSFSVFHFPNSRRFGAALLGLVAAGLLLAAFNQDRVPYPHNLRSAPPASIPQAVQRIIAYPAQSQAHLDLTQLMAEPGQGETQGDKGTGGQGDTGTGGQEMGEVAEDTGTTDEDRETKAFLADELRTALWLEPKNTRARDILAVLLMEQGKVDEGLQEVTRSVMDAPYMSDHFYLSKDSIAWLVPSELDAIEQGFKRAVAAERPGALDQLGLFYAETERFAERAALYEDVASSTADSELKSAYILEAASSRVAANELEKAEGLLRQAVAIGPEDPEPYRQLITDIYGAQDEVGAARAVVADAMKAGVDGFDLYLSLAKIAHAAGDAETANEALAAARDLIPGSDEKHRLNQYAAVFHAAHKAGERELAKSVLEEMAKITPSTFQDLYRLASLYLADRNFDRAAFYYSKAVGQNPHSAVAFYRLARVEEYRFQYPEAKIAYETAIRLDPENKDVQKRYEAFKEKLAVR